MDITRVLAEHAADWDAAIADYPAVTPFHSSEWKNALSASLPQYQGEDYFLESVGERIGAWSGFAFTPAPFFAFSESSSWHLFGGYLAPGHEPDVAQFTEAVAQWESEGRRLRRCGASLTLPPSVFSACREALEAAGFTLDAEKTTHHLALPGDPETLWKDVYKGSVRTDVRKSQKSGVQIRSTMTTTDADAFYAIYAATMERFGSPAKPRSLVRWLALSPIGRLLVAEREGRIVAGLLALHFANTLTVWMAASLPDERRHAPNHALYHQILSWAVENGFRSADFGASPQENGSLMAFKESFGAAPAKFGTYRKVYAPIRAALWARAEPLAKRVLGRLGK